MKKFWQIASVLYLAAAFLTAGCKKEKAVDYDTQSSQDHALAESIFNELHEIADEAALTGDLSTHRYGNNEGSLLSACATVTSTLDSTTGAGNVTIDFGSHFCLGIDNRYRKGNVSVSFNGAYRNPGTVITIIATDYFVAYDSLYATKVNGTRTVTNKALNSDGNPVFSIHEDATFISYLNQVMTWHSSREREWIAGDSTATMLDDIYSITGSSNGQSFAGVNFSAFISVALRLDRSCPWRIVEGKFQLTPEDKPARKFDYGNRACDGDATVTIGDKIYQVVLR